VESEKKALLLVGGLRGGKTRGGGGKRGEKRGGYIGCSVGVRR